MQNQHQNIIHALDFLKEVTDRRLQEYFHKEKAFEFRFPQPVIVPDNGPLHSFLVHHQLHAEEFTILLLALAPHVQPGFLDAIIQSYLPNGGEFAEIGAVKGQHHRGSLPTGETALFILAGADVSKRLQATSYFSQEHFFARKNILQLEAVKDGEPPMSGKIILQQEYVDLFTTGHSSKPRFGPDFPAKAVTTKMDWQDLIINSKTRRQIEDIRVWLQYNETLVTNWQMEKRVKPGYRALFYGPSGTGKTFTVTLLGKQFNKEVYRIDLSQVVSKYIGETEKNLENVFRIAENKDWILFFDEADALFGKRSGVQNAHDKYANQEVSYLLQRVEDFPGLIILASNFKSNIDQAFVRRFNAIIHFPMPTATERLGIWQSCLPVKATLDKTVDLQQIASKYELSGAAIMNVVHYAALQSASRQSNSISKDDLVEGIKREYEKEDRVFS
ncbi:ATP-binding protein [Foetidibacter luteolus]|uniref:ATP-binding protein n=1 Tax=Foetidibacter luteolus TaxID=2608880 RepID=UPI00129A8127|nr:ATP-binding protein [Foetidibacter luteolus]